jgi:hypothetical protein
MRKKEDLPLELFNEMQKLEILFYEEDIEDEQIIDLISKYCVINLYIS